MAGVILAIMILPIVTSVARDSIAATPAPPARGGAGARRHAVGDDPPRRPAVRARRHLRRHHPGPVARHRRDDRRAVRDRQPAPGERVDLLARLHACRRSSPLSSRRRPATSIARRWWRSASSSSSSRSRSTCSRAGSWRARSAAQEGPMSAEQSLRATSGTSAQDEPASSTGLCLAAGAHRGRSARGGHLLPRHRGPEGVDARVPRLEAGGGDDRGRRRPPRHRRHPDDDRPGARSSPRRSGIAVALYVVEYRAGRLAIAVRTAVDLVAGIPSIVIGLFVYSLVVLTMGHFSGFAGRDRTGADHAADHRPHRRGDVQDRAAPPAGGDDGARHPALAGGGPDLHPDRGGGDHDRHRARRVAGRGRDGAAHLHLARQQLRHRPISTVR